MIRDTPYHLINTRLDILDTNLEMSTVVIDIGFIMGLRLRCGTAISHIIYTLDD